ncbi:hypothetical protein [Spiroplasma diminutum]|uniref:Uncharacterized protein n=1 Tax=Spiroplasma diminutum CUAS-1 TaxID=1276221 RepID=S5MEC8_9MOLU|nr:hypothetical protein [Spiroplasma diminutum]AGR42093.1 hypothetical protein SDIMI_v3c03890 [Spiroplasma diminutum CUAS-1]
MNLNNTVEILDMTKYTLDEITELLNEGKTLIMALEKGEHVNASLNESFSKYLNANIKLKEEKENCGTCGCGQPANILVYVWK